MVLRWSLWLQSQRSSSDRWLLPLYGCLLNRLSRMDYIALLLSSFLFGGMLLFSIGFGSLSFKFLDVAVARKFVRRTFPYFYGYVLCISATTALFCLGVSTQTVVLAALIFFSTIPTSRMLMPAINKAADAKHKRSFVVLHTLSVSITIFHIFISAALLYLILKS